MGLSSVRSSRKTRACEIGTASVSDALPRLPSNSDNNPSDSAETNSPQTLWRGERPRSRGNTFTPACAPVIAADETAGTPPPTTGAAMNPKAASLGLFSGQRDHAHQALDS